jgi:VWFA-related protein
MNNRVSTAVFLTLAISVSSLAQKPAPTTSQALPPPPQQRGPGDDDVVRITSNLVQVDAVVTDKKGRQVTDLSIQDFEVLEDGHPQKITNLSYVSIRSPAAGSEAPVATAAKDRTGPPIPVRLHPEQVHRTIALVVDDLGLSFESMVYVRQALKSS